MPEGKGSGQADGVFPRTVVHFKGETTLKEAPQRVAIVSTGQLDAVLSLGVVPVGATAPSGTDVVPQYLLDKYPQQASDLKAISYLGSRTEPSVESIATIKPDLILVNSAGKNIDELYKTLSELAPTVVTEGTGVNWKSDFLLLADPLGKVEQAQKWLDEYHRSAAELGEKVPDDQTISFLRRDGERIRVFGVASFTGSIAEDCGLSRPESQRFQETSVDLSGEQIDQADGSWIFYGVKGGDASELTSLPLWGTLSAVEEKRAVQVDDDPFYLNAGPTAARVVLDTLTTSLAG